ncbi:hypothetical protein SAMD00023353_0401920 [Rosellinia necatrix]|uniref:Uncharacterized protein n=1 Tax=Rosellinia necatrix TaxID=77044 RepID=A0A1S8A5G1_ROSNE|nr:hypothetical protein SAMD00023353_0401920 [Rosellinia necatrix]
MDKRESDFHLTIATEQFLHGGDFYPPGSSLAVPGLVSAGDHMTYHNTDTLTLVNLQPWRGLNYGYPVNRTDYKDHLSPVVSNISTTAQKAAGWERLEINECKAEYVACRGLKKHRSVVLVVDNPSGWVRDDIWQLNETEREFWDQYIPSAKPNHLFFDAQCAMVAAINKRPGVSISCNNNCVNALGNGEDYGGVLNSTDWNYPFFGDLPLKIVNGSKPSEYDYKYNLTKPDSNWIRSEFDLMTSGLQQNSFNLNISYCLAEPLENICHIGLSPTLLLGVTLCVIVKTITAVVATSVLNRPEHKPLVTLGDAVESFIKHPDPATEGFCTIDQKDIRASLKQKGGYLIRSSRRWEVPQRKWAAAVPISIWLISYALFASGIIISAAFLFGGLTVTNSLGSFLASDTNGFAPLLLSLIQGVVLANSPQLLLSFCYLAYNNLFTRLQMAQEWAAFGEGYSPLRVTDPRGQQYSTYRLQLPYKYSIPLIVVSIFLHWLVSNSIYVFVSTGGYFSTPFFNRSWGVTSDPSLPDYTAVSIGYSLLSLLVLIIVSIALVTIPLILTRKILPSNITLPGSNSLAISAACHASTVSQASRESATMDDSSLSSQPENMPSSYTPTRTYSPINSDIDLRSQRSPRKNSLWKPGSRSTMRSWFSEKRRVGDDDGDGVDDDDDDDDDAQSPLKRLAQSRLRWGVISMPAEWYSEYDHDGPVEHLGFGGEEEQPRDPVPGHMYA